MCGLACGVQLEGLWEGQALSHVIRVSRTDCAESSPMPVGPATVTVHTISIVKYYGELP